jgi:hypothetical protein
MSKNTYTYIGVKPCGCVTFAMVAGYDSKKAEDAELKRVIKSGRKIEVVTAEEARERMTFDCPHSEHIEDVAAYIDQLRMQVQGDEVGV